MNGEKKFFFLRLNPPRPDFPDDMTNRERGIMQEHIEYWKPYLNDGTLIVYGPVMDPKGTFGMAVLCVDDEEQARQLASHDPAAAIGSIDVLPMKAVIKQVS